MRDGLVYRKRGDQILFYVPACLDKNVLFKYHEMGHVGADKALENISRSYWFPRMKEKVGDHVRKCLKCIVYAADSGRTPGVLHSIPKGNAPFTDLHVDHVGPLTKVNSTRKRYVLLVIDGFTKFIKLYATGTTSSEEAIRCLREYFRIYSRPLRLVSDRGTCFTSQKFADFMREMNVQHIKVATASP